MGIVDEFHKLYYNSKVWANETHWRGVKLEKFPTDLWILQEIIHRTKPNKIIETGTKYGGSAWFMADMLNLFLGYRRRDSYVMTIDINCDVDKKIDNPTKLGNILYIIGDSINRETERIVECRLFPEDKVMVVLDSAHDVDHVTKELETYSKFVTEGCYLIVEDTNLGGHPIMPGFGGGGPSVAVTEFLKTHKEFEIDRGCEKFMLTSNPGGFLKRI